MPTSLVDRPGTFRPMLWLTLPVLVEQMLHVLVGFTDLWLTGNYLPGRSLRGRDDADDLRALARGQRLWRSRAWFYGNGCPVRRCARSRNGESCDESIDSHWSGMGAAADGHCIAICRGIPNSDGTERHGCGRGRTLSDN